MNRQAGRLYVIGIHETGVLFVKTEPLRAVTVSRDEIERYAEERAISYDAAFARIAEGTKSITGRLEEEDDSADIPEHLESLPAQVRGRESTCGATYCAVSEATTGRTYIVGDRESGILAVTTDPLRSSTVTPSEIAAYASKHRIDFDEALLAVAETMHQVAQVTAKPRSRTDADFCMLAKMDDGIWNSARRISVPPIETALEALNSRAEDVTEVRLRDSSYGIGAVA